MKSSFKNKKQEIEFYLELNKCKDQVGKTLGDYGSRYERPKIKKYQDPIGGFWCPNFSKWAIALIFILASLPYIIRLFK